MAGPLLNRQLLLETPEQVADGAGGFVTTWVALGTLWGALRPGSGRRARGTSGPLSRVPYRITVRAAAEGSPARPKPGQRLREGTRVYAILAVTEAKSDGRYLLLQAEEEVAV